MKKSLLFAAVAAMVLTSCMKNEPIDANYGKQAIGFSTYTTQSTRGTDAAIAQVQGGGFGVYAAVTPSTGYPTTGTEFPAVNFMKAQKVTYATNAWSYSPVKYWPETGTDGALQKVTFWAYYPYEATGRAVMATNKDAADVVPNFTYTTPAASTDQTDLLAAVAYDQSKNDPTVDLTFKHILSKITFSAKLDAAIAANNQFTITNVAVNYLAEKVINAGTFTYANDANAGSWALGTTYFAATAASAQTLANSITLTTTTDVELCTVTGSPLMIIPQNMPADAIAVTFDYTIENTDTASGDGKSTNNVTINLPATTFAQGKAYDFTFKFTPKTVVFDTVTVAPDWEADTTQPGETALP